MYSAELAQLSTSPAIVATASSSGGGSVKIPANFGRLALRDLVRNEPQLSTQARALT